MKMFALLAVAAVLSGPSVTCRIAISYPKDNPQKISFQVPDKSCDIEGMEKALATTLLLLQR